MLNLWVVNPNRRSQKAGSSSCLTLARADSEGGADGSGGTRDGSGASGSDGAQGSDRAEGGDGAQGSTGASNNGGGQSSVALDPAVEVVQGLGTLSQADKEYLSALLEYMRAHVSPGKNSSVFCRHFYHRRKQIRHARWIRYLSRKINPKDIDPETYESSADEDDFESAAFALASCGVVKVFIPAEGLTSPTTLSRVEWLNIMPEVNPDIASVVWVDPSNTDNTKIIWTSNSSWRTFPLNTPVSDNNP